MGRPVSPREKTYQTGPRLVNRILRGVRATRAHAGGVDRSGLMIRVSVVDLFNNRRAAAATSLPFEGKDPNPCPHPLS